MFQALIVDDEVHAANGVEQGVDWERLNVSGVFIAHHIKQAKEILGTRPIDIVICDIEMPQGSGLELQQWIREADIKVETVFLTCHAEFQYAQLAVQLGSLEYMLKPVRFDELERTLQKALAKIQKAREQTSFNETLRTYYKLWSIHQPLLIERFWLDLIQRDIPPHPESIQDALSRRNIPYSSDMTFSIVLVAVRRWHKELLPKDEKILAYALRNSAEHLYRTEGMPCQAVQLMKGTLLVIFPSGGKDEADLAAACGAYIESCSRYFYCDINCYIGTSVMLEQVPDMVERLIERDKDNVNSAGRVFSLEDRLLTNSSVPMPNLNEWSNLLKQGAKEGLIREISAYFDGIGSIASVNAQHLHDFSHDFTQMVYYVMKLQGLQAHRMFTDKTFQRLAAEATRSVQHLRQWAVLMAETAFRHMRDAKESGTVVERVKRYIAENIGQSLNRDELAAHFYLNPDYLSRIFKKETGQLLSDYLLAERIRLSKDLLAKTDLPVSTVAVTVGYANFSHYAKIFKQATGLTPQEYRKSSS